MKRRIITAASQGEDTRLQDAINQLKDDFEYAIMGLEHMERDGAAATTDALAIAETLQSNLNSVIDSIANHNNKTDNTAE